MVQKGQPLFKITPDEKFVEVDPKAVERERRAATAEHLKAVLISPDERLVEGAARAESERPKGTHLKAV